MTKDEIEIINKHYIEAYKVFENVEWEKAPSGEWHEYNAYKLKLESAVDSIELLMLKLGLDIPEVEEE